jgi:hypothetical protein
MIGVTVVALLLAVGIWSMRVGRQAEIYARRAKSLLALEKEYRYQSKKLSAGPEASASLAALMAESARRASELGRKYERAARYPWLPVEPDPPR